MHVGNLFIPLIAYPYLIRTLGGDLYGLIVYAQTIAAYFLIIVSFGFNIAGTKSISESKFNNEKISEVVSSIFIIKGFLFLVTLLFLSILLILIPIKSDNYLLFFLCMWVCLYDWLFPIWYFLGKEIMKFITLLTLLSKFLYLALILLLVKSDNDLLLVPIIQGGSSLLSALMALYIVFVKDKVNFKLQSKTTLKYYTLKSLPLLASGISVQVFVLMNRLLIGNHLGMNYLAIYDLAEKIINLLKKPQLIITQVIFPRMSRSYNKIFLMKMAVISLLISLLFIIVIIVYGNYIVLLLGGKEMIDSYNVLLVFSIVLPIIYLSQYTSVHTLLANGFNKLWMRTVIISALIYLMCVLVVINYETVTVITFVYCTIMAEVTTLTCSIYYSRKKGLI